jgi:hypothetical protein
MSSSSTNKQPQKDEKPNTSKQQTDGSGTPTPTSSFNAITNESIEPLDKIDSNFLIHLRKMNNQLDNEESFSKLNRPVRHLLYKQDILNNQLIQIYKITSNNLINFDPSELSKLFDSQQIANSATLSPNDLKSHLSKLNNEYRKCFKLFQTHVELCKLTVDLTTPIELLLINRHFIYNTLSKLDLYDQHEMEYTGEHHSAPGSTSGESSKMKNMQTINANLSIIIEANLEKFKDLFF